MKVITDFEIMAKMASDNMDIQMSNQVVSANYNHKIGTKVTMGFGGDVASKLGAMGKQTHAVVSYVVNLEQHAKIKAELEAECTPKKK